MPTKRKSGKPEMLSRDVEIKSSRLRVRISAVHRKGDEPEIESQPWLELKGVLITKIRNDTGVIYSHRIPKASRRLHVIVRDHAPTKNGNPPTIRIENMPQLMD